MQILAGFKSIEKFGRHQQTRVSGSNAQVQSDLAYKVSGVKKSTITRIAGFFMVSRMRNIEDQYDS